MKKISMLLLAGVAVIFSACQKNSTMPEQNEVPVPESRPLGQTTGSLQQFTIGAGGGTIASADGKLTIVIPAGAVTEATQFSIQPITNTADAGIGGGFRLLPHGVNFQKPVRISFQYDHLLDSIASKEVVSIAFQDQQGVWQMPRPITQDTARNIITTNTLHFSDWVLVTWLKLVPSSAMVNPGEQLPLTILNFHPSADDLLAPLNSADVTTLPLGKGKPVPGALVKNWQLIGVGALAGSGSKASYTAPANASPTATATAVATLNSLSHQLLLLAHIRIMGEGIYYRYNGGAYRSIPGHVGLTPGGKAGLAGEDASEVFTITWTGSSGTFKWSYTDGSTAVTITNQALSYYYAAMYQNNDGDMVDSGGSIKVDNWGPVGTVVTGSFSISPAGQFSGATGLPTGADQVDGYFRVKRIK
jgi:hypothetical protein